MPEITNAEAISQWSKAPHQIVENFGNEGDFARQYLLNPALFALVGDATGKKLLDAGCGEGYLCRLLAKKGMSRYESISRNERYGKAMHICFIAH